MPRSNRVRRGRQFGRKWPLTRIHRSLSPQKMGPKLRAIYFALLWDDLRGVRQKMSKVAVQRWTR